VVGVLSDDRAYRTATNAGRVAVRDWRAAHAGRVHGISFRPRRASEPAGTDRITVERHRLSHARAATAPAAPITLSLLAHAACLLAFVLLLPSRMMLPDIPGSTQVSMVFDPAAATVPPVPAAPAATPAAVPTPPEPTLEATPTNAPPPPQVTQPSATQVPVPPAPAAPARPRTALAPVPAPPPVRTAAAPLPAPPVHIAQAVPEAVAPPTRTPPAERQVAPRPHSEPARKFASLTPPPAPAPAEAQSAEVAAARPVASGPLIPPRPVAGMETNRAPAYPEIALRRDEQGRVMLRVSVSADGRPLEVEVAQTSGYPSLDAAALSAVRQWRFVPAMQAGTAVAAIAEVPVRFRIDN
jgi:protein TonB